MTPIEHSHIGLRRPSSPPVALPPSQRGSLASVLDDLTRSVPDCLAAGFIDLKTGALMGMSTGVSTRERAASELFGQAQLMPSESLFRKAPTVGAEAGYFREVLVLAGELICVYQRCEDNTNWVLMTVCGGSTNMGILLDRSREQLPAIGRMARRQT